MMYNNKNTIPILHILIDVNVLANTLFNGFGISILNLLTQFWTVEHFICQTVWVNLSDMK